ncbi:hypothetical protein SUGI_0077480 [Cryptomeria japonica]|nr:hypothetical protein SUGI_0077480 [Cryptomeria japonica]
MEEDAKTKALRQQLNDLNERVVSLLAEVINTTEPTQIQWAAFRLRENLLDRANDCVRVEVLNSGHSALREKFEYLEDNMLALSVRLTFRLRFVRMYESENKKVAAEIVGCLPVIKNDSGHVDEDLQCVICSDDFKLGEEALQLPCHRRHIFHTQSLHSWILINRK